ncbi:glutaredoxin family protein [Halodesulfovibrio aestuarii]|uniref:Glutaredoxin family protein n=1 Tax=Halodesulfovibrio aestuarii TaxID=126333 RepID=A0A8G2C9P2_9BACT|nr:glutaredoxin family protein [Halodesulfovibrio aestuarii]SHJ12882.1 glutaredoxin-like protein NrdH [Halodesulfovibrio aestuarii]
MSIECTLYALSTCIHCRRMKVFLEDHDVAFDNIFVDKLRGDERKEILDKIRNYNPKLSFPTLVVKGGECIIVGFHKDKVEEALNL